jgi:hypothetical protein
MLGSLPKARAFAHPPLSNYFGLAMHAEQAAVANA